MLVHLIVARRITHLHTLGWRGILVLQHRLDSFASIDQFRDKPGQDTWFEIRRRYRRDLLLSLLWGQSISNLVWKELSIRTNSVWWDRLDSREVNVVFLDNAGVQRVEVHDKDNLVVKLSLRFEHKATFVLIPVVLVLVLGAFSGAVFRRHICLMSFFRVLLGSNSGLFPPGLVRDDIFELVELMQKDVLIPFCSPTVEGFVPSLRLNNTDYSI